MKRDFEERVESSRGRDRGTHVERKGQLWWESKCSVQGGISKPALG